MTSHQSHENSGESRGNIAGAIESLALQAGANGITINEATTALPQFKAVSVSPVFKPLVKSGKLFRRIIGRTEPSEKWPNGKDILQTRFDPTTNRECVLHFHHSVDKKPPTSVALKSKKTEHA
jgi:hypothetical protein